MAKENSSHNNHENRAQSWLAGLRGSHEKAASHQTSENAACPREESKDSATGAEGRVGQADALPNTREHLLLRLQEDICAHLSQIDRVELIKMPRQENSYWAAVLLREGDIDRQTLSQSLMAHGADQGILLFPALYSPNEWQALCHVAEEKGWLSGLDEEGGQVPLIEHYRKQRTFPRGLRHLLIKTIRAHLAFFDFMQRSFLVPRHLSLDFSTLVLRDALDLLFATKNAQFTHSTQSIVFFNQQFTASGHFSKNDILFYFQMAGLAKQTKHYYRLTLDDEADLGWLAFMKKASRFLEAMERYVQDAFTTAEDHRRRKKRKRFIALGLALAFVFSLVGYFIFTRPQSSLAKQSMITQTGGIVGHYYRGINFDKKVVERTDNTIDIVTNGRIPVAPNLSGEFFSVRWQGFLSFQETGKYYLCSQSDDGARVFFNNAALVEDWTNHPAKKACAAIRVRSEWYPIKVEYYNRGSFGTMRLLVGQDEEHLSLVSAQNLCCRNN